MDLARSQTVFVSLPERYSGDTVKIVRLSGDRDLTAVGRLRAKVWREQEGIWVPDFASADENVWLDEYDAEAVHFVAYSNGKIIGAARMTIHDSLEEMIDGDVFAEICQPKTPIASFNRLVVLREHRGHGVAKMLDAARIREARRQGVREVFLVAVGEHRSSAVSELGFTELLRFPSGHGLTVPERPLIGFHGDPTKLHI